MRNGTLLLLAAACVLVACCSRAPASQASPPSANAASATAADPRREEARAAYGRAEDAATRGDSAAFLSEVNALIRQETAAAEEMIATLFADSRFESMRASKAYIETESDYVPRWSQYGLDAIFERYAVPTPTAGLTRVLDPGDLEAHADFRTRIEEGLAGEPNFAGSCVVVEWGCGSGCQSGVILDLANGRIRDLPVSSLGRLYRVTSGLLVVDPPLPDDPRPAETRSFPSYWRWTGSELVLLVDTATKDR